MEKRQTFCRFYAKVAATFYNITCTLEETNFRPIPSDVSRLGGMRRFTRARKLHDFPLINLIYTNRTDSTAFLRKKGHFEFLHGSGRSLESGNTTRRYIPKSLCDIYHTQISILIAHSFITKNISKVWYL